MDFQTLNRRELQALCKLNKIPANITNVAMVDALKSLETVEGIEEFLNPSKSETAGLSTEAPEWNDLTSPAVPRTSCRTSIRQKVKKPEAESLHATVNRSRRQLAVDANEFLKTPLVSSTRKKALASQLNECEDIAENECLVNQEKNCIPNTPVVTATVGRRKGVAASTVKKETATAYSTRRSTRLTAKKSEELCVIERERSEPVKIDSFLDEVKDSGKPIEEKHDVVVLDESDAISKIEKVVHVDTTTLESEDEKIDSEDFKQLENVNAEELKPDSENMCNPDGDSDEKSMVIDENDDLKEALNVSVKEQDDFLVPEEHTDKFVTEADDIDTFALSFNTENQSDPSILKFEETINEISEHNGAPSIDDVMTEEGIKENTFENKVDFGEVQEYSMAVDVIMPAVIHGEVDQEGDVDEVVDVVMPAVIHAEGDVDEVVDVVMPAVIHGEVDQEGDVEDEVVDVSDNKENEENNTEKEGEGDEKAAIKSLHETSLRQLKKQLKALKIKSNMNESCVTSEEMEEKY